MNFPSKENIILHRVQYSLIHKYCLITRPIWNFMTFDWWQMFSVYRTFLDMLVPYKTIKKIALYEYNEKFAYIWLFNKNNLKKWRVFESVRDNLWRCAIVRATRGVCNITCTIFHCRQDANNFKNIFTHFGGQNDHFLAKKGHL